jgi:hypothetical protein
MILDDNSITEPAQKASYQKTRGELATLLHDANKLVIDAFELIKNLPHQAPADNHVAAVLLARHVIEMTDGVAVLIAKRVLPLQFLISAAITDAT